MLDTRQSQLDHCETIRFVKLSSLSDCGSKHAARQVFFMRNKINLHNA